MLLVVVALKVAEDSWVLVAACEVYSRSARSVASSLDLTCAVKSTTYEWLQIEGQVWYISVRMVYSVRETKRVTGFESAMGKARLYLLLILVAHG